MGHRGAFRTSRALPFIVHNMRGLACVQAPLVICYRPVTYGTVTYRPVTFYKSPKGRLSNLRWLTAQLLAAMADSRTCVRCLWGWFVRVFDWPSPCGRSGISDMPRGGSVTAPDRSDPLSGTATPTTQKYDYRTFHRTRVRFSSWPRGCDVRHTTITPNGFDTVHGVRHSHTRQHTGSTGEGAST
jgi:hypothetical protein